MLLRRIELVLGDRAEVAEHVREVDAVGARVGADALLLGEHGGVVLGLLEDLQRDPLLHVGGDRDRLEGRAVPAGAGDAPLVTAGDQPGLDLLGRQRHGARDPGDQLVAGAVVELVEHRAVQRDHPRAAVGDQRAAHRVDDQAAGRLLDDLAHRLRRRLRLVVGAADDLQVVEPHEQGREQREDERLDDHEPQPPGRAPRLGGRAGSSPITPAPRPCGRARSGRGPASPPGARAG